MPARMCRFARFTLLIAGVCMVVEGAERPGPVYTDATGAATTTLQVGSTPGPIIVGSSCGELSAQDLFRPLFVVQSAEPDFTSVGQYRVPIRFAQHVINSGEAYLHHLGERVQDNCGLDMVEAEPQNCVAGEWCLQRPQHNRSDQHERLTGATSSKQHRVSGAAGYYRHGLLLLCG